MRDRGTIGSRIPAIRPPEGPLARIAWGKVGGFGAIAVTSGLLRLLESLLGGGILSDVWFAIAYQTVITFGGTQFVLWAMPAMAYMSQGMSIQSFEFLIQRVWSDHGLRNVFLISAASAVLVFLVGVLRAFVL